MEQNRSVSHTNRPSCSYNYSGKFEQLQIEMVAFRDAILRGEVAELD